MQILEQGLGIVTSSRLSFAGGMIEKGGLGIASLSLRVFFFGTNRIESLRAVLGRSGCLCLPEAGINAGGLEAAAAKLSPQPPEAPPAGRTR
jgi:hypothetical protein